MVKFMDRMWDHEDMRILFATLNSKSFSKHAQGIIVRETAKSFTIKTLGIIQIIKIDKNKIETYHIETLTTAFARLQYD